MRRLLIFAAWFLCAGIAQAAANDEQEIRSLVTQFGTAWAHSDTAVLDKLLAPDYIHTDIYGAVQHRTEWLKYAGQPRALEIEFEDVDVRVFGDVAIVTGGNTIWNPKDGKEKANRIRFTQVWQRNKGGWQRLAFQATPITAK